jgi:hypothetical protein
MLAALATLDDDPGARPEAHIFVANKAPRFTITQLLAGGLALP